MYSRLFDRHSLITQTLCPEGWGFFLFHSESWSTESCLDHFRPSLVSTDFPASSSDIFVLEVSKHGLTSFYWGCHANKLIDIDQRSNAKPLSLELVHHFLLLVMEVLRTYLKPLILQEFMLHSPHLTLRPKASPLPWPTSQPMLTYFKRYWTHP